MSEETNLIPISNQSTNKQEDDFFVSVDVDRIVSFSVKPYLLIVQTRPDLWSIDAIVKRRSGLVWSIEMS